jgi:sugar phosphate isomerase/epimerase
VREENIMEHSFSVTLLAHALAVIHNEEFGGNADVLKTVLYATYHETSEVMTGDLPTPIKYYNRNIQGAYKALERSACEKIVATLPQKMQKSIGAAALLGAKNWVVHPLMPFGIEDIGTGNEQATWDINVEFMQQLLTTAKEYDVTICLENMPMPKFSLGSVSDVLRFVKRINDRHFKICLDTGHVAVFPGGSPADALRKLGSEVRVLHIHDNDGKSDLHKIPFEGIIDWVDFAKALYEVNYPGVFSYETAPSATVSIEEAEQIYKQMIENAKNIGIEQK